MALTAGTLIALLGFLGSPQDDKTFQPAIKRFQDDYYKVGAKDDEKIQAVNYLAQNRHDRIVRVLSPLMLDASIPVRIMVARSLGQFAGVDTAPRELVAALQSQANAGKKQTPVRIEILRSLGTLKYRPAAADVSRLIEDKDVWVAKAAIDASRGIKGVESIAPLIKSLQRIEGKEGDAEVTVNPLDDILEGVNNGSLFKHDAREPKRPSQRELLRAPILASLSGITKQSFQTAKEWDAWWQKNKSTFRIPE